MRRTKRAFISIICALALIVNGLTCVSAVAQDKEPQSKPVEQVIIHQTTDGVPSMGVRVPHPADGMFDIAVAQGSGEHTFKFLSAEMSFDNKVVKGAPFSAEMVYESIQTLADGNRIVNRSSSAIHRDSQGRIRREQAFNFFGPFGGGSTERKNIHIFDPVSGDTYMLDPENRVARKFGVPPRFARSSSPAGAGRTEGGSKEMNVSGGVLQGSAVKRVQPAYPEVAKAARASGPVQVQITVDESGNVTSAEAKTGHSLLQDAAVTAARQWQFKPTAVEGKPVKVQGLLTFNFTLSGNEENAPSIATKPVAFSARVKMESKSESLGTQTIEGVQAEGTRSINTIPAGAIGNERPIEIIHERWYSPELQMVVLSRSVDPRMGETTLRLVNLSRGEPDASLFQVPSDYKVDSSQPMIDKIEGVRMRRPNEQ
jgi:TonB family protein